MGVAGLGVSWPATICCEGFFLNVWRDPLAADQTRVNGVKCFGCSNFLTAGHILVGTAQAGIVETFNRGKTWRTIPLSDYIPNVTSFFFGAKGKVIISSYARGLWKHEFSCPNSYEDAVPPVVVTGPTIYWKRARVPLLTVREPENCAACGYFLMQGGDVLDFAVDQGGRLREVSTSGGSLRGFTFERKEVAPTFGIKHTGWLGKLGGDNDLVAEVKAGSRIKGLYLDGKVLKGVILARYDVHKEDLPRTMALGPYVRVDVRQHVDPKRGTSSTVVAVSGTGFRAQHALTVSLDGKRVKMKWQPCADHKGNFRFTLPSPGGIGGHTVLVEQDTRDGVLRDAANYLITVQDVEEEDGGEDNKRRSGGRGACRSIEPATARQDVAGAAIQLDRLRLLWRRMGR